MSTTLTDQDYARAATTLGVPVAAIRAVVEVECAGSGFIPPPDNRPAILYEAHVFHRETKGRYAGAKDRNDVALSVPNWDRTLYGPAGAHQHNRLEDAARLDYDAAHKACSWGMGQVLGTNHQQVGFNKIQDFVDAMKSGAAAQLDAMVQFIKTNKLDTALRRLDWAAFARGYNGPGYATNKYDTKLAQAYQRWLRAPAGDPTPTLRLGARGDAVRDLQQRLSIQPVDGVFGPQTDVAVKMFQQANSLVADGIVGPMTWARLTPPSPPAA